MFGFLVGKSRWNQKIKNEECKLILCEGERKDFFEIAQQDSVTQKTKNDFGCILGFVFTTWLRSVSFFFTNQNTISLAKLHAEKTNTKS